MILTYLVTKCHAHDIHKLQSLVYNILPSAIAITGYDIGQSLVYNILPSAIAIIGYDTGQSLVYNILPSAIAIIGYAIGLWELSANWQFLVGAQIDLCLKHTTQIISGISFITAHITYIIKNKTIWIGTVLILFTSGRCT